MTVKTDKSELAKKISMIQSVVPRKGTMSILKNILVSDGCLIANDTHTAAKVRLEGAEGEKFLIPLSACGLISSLPEGDAEITEDGHAIRITAPNISVRMNTLDAEAFPLPTVIHKGCGTATVGGTGFLRAVKRVAVAVSDSAANPMMEAMLMRAGNGMMDIVGTDGKRMAWETIPCDGDLEILVPKSTVNKLKGLNPDGNIIISHDPHGAMFETDSFAVTTRLANGVYFKFEQMFLGKRIELVTKRKDILAAVERARTCVEDRSAVSFDISEDAITVSARQKCARYEEAVPLAEPAPVDGGLLTIGLDSRLLVDALKALEDEVISLWVSDDMTPVVLEGEASTYQALILPVNPGTIRR